MVLTSTAEMTSPPPGGCHRKVVEVVPWDISVLGQLVVATAAGQEVPIVQSQVKTFLQRFDVVHLQFLVKPRNAEDPIASFVTHPAEMEVPPDNTVSFLLPGVGFTECSCFAVPMLRRLRFLGAYISTRMDTAAIST